MQRVRVIMLAALILMLVGYYSSWYQHETAGFTMNAFDLAEWTSLHPAVRSGSPPLLTSFLLRLPLLTLAMAWALNANDYRNAYLRWLMRGSAGLLLLRLIPPADFVTSASSDPNYRQMALLTVLGGAGWLAALTAGRLPERMRAPGAIVLLLTGAAIGWFGLSRADELLANFEIAVSIGVGPVLYSVGAGLASLALLWRWREHTHADRVNHAPVLV